MIKLSQRDGVNIGDKFEFTRKDENTFKNGDIIEITREDIRASDRHYFIILQNKNNEELSLYDSTILSCFKKIPKPHEYSPVEMTGRYRTIGD